MSETEPRTVGQALERFELVGGTAGSESDGTACAMSLLSWVDGSVWSDHPECAYPRLADVVIAANDAAATTVEQRVELVRAGVTGVLDTWWLPGVVVAWAIAEGIKAGDDPVARALATMAAVGRWKTSEVKPRPVLRGADLRDADLRGAVLSGARGNKWTMLPDGWQVTGAGAIERVAS